MEEIVVPKMAQAAAEKSSPNRPANGNGAKKPQTSATAAQLSFSIATARVR